jgi:hypothetical protein
MDKDAFLYIRGQKTASFKGADEQLSRFSISLRETAEA